MWNRNFFCHINKQEISQPSVISGLQMWIRVPKTVIQGMLPPPPPWWLLRSWGNARNKVNKKTWLAPDSWDAYERNEFSEPKGVHLPIHRVINSLTWYLTFNVQTACSLCCKLVYSLPLYSPLPLWEKFSQRYWDTVSQAWSPKHFHQIKQPFTFRLWLYFLVDKDQIPS